MIKYFIKVNIGDNNITHNFSFIHKDFENITKEESDIAFDKAVKELDRIYENYGRFATTRGVEKLFNTFGFESFINIK